MKKILIILIGCLLSFKTFGFEKFNLNDVDPSENIIVEDLKTFLGELQNG